MRAVIGHLNEPYRGVDLADGELRMDLVSDPEADARYFERALVAEMQRMGADVRKLVLVGQKNAGEGVEDIIHVTDWDGRFICRYEEEPALNAIFMETIAVSAGVAGGMVPAGEVACGIIEACAEVTRALLAGAVTAALMDGGDEADVVVIFHAGPEIAHKANLSDGGVSALLRVRGCVYRKTDPERSYLLGENAERMAVGGRKPLQVVWTFPLVEHFYGPGRLRWKDKRSAPSYVRETPKVLAS
jgi:hypothetical protein